MSNPTWIEKLKSRWNVKSAGQVVIILIVFACTGFSVLFIKRPLLTLLAGDQGNSTLGTVLYYIFILPVYNILLLGYGFLFGQFSFFWNFEKRMLERFFTRVKRK